MMLFKTASGARILVVIVIRRFCLRFQSQSSACCSWPSHRCTWWYKRKECCLTAPSVGGGDEMSGLTFDTDIAKQWVLERVERCICGWFSVQSQTKVVSFFCNSIIVGFTVIEHISKLVYIFILLKQFEKFDYSFFERCRRHITFSECMKNYNDVFQSRFLN